MKLNKVFRVARGIILALFFLCSCSKNFIKPFPQGGLSSDIIANNAGVQKLLIGVYGVLDGVGNFGDAWATSQDNWVYGSVAGGDAHKGSDQGDQSDILSIARFESSSTNVYFNAKWTALFEGVSRANSVLRILPQVTDMTDVQKTEAAAESRFLRAHFYFELKKMFNNVPWIDENTTDFNQPNTGTDIWANIEADFLFAKNNLPAIQSDAARVNQWAAAAYLAKSYIYQQKWQAAKDLYDVIIPNGVTSQGVHYDIFPKYSDIFNPAVEDGAPMTVFSIRFVSQDIINWSDNGNAGNALNFPYNSPFDCCGFFQPTQELVNSFKTQNGLPMVDNHNTVMVKSDFGFAYDSLFTPYQGTVDPRLDWTVGRRGIPFHDWGPHPGDLWIRGGGTSNGPYSSKKYVYWHRDLGTYADQTRAFAADYYVIRFEEVLLNAAEAEVEIGSLEKAREYVNRIRNRAANPDGFVSYQLNRAYAVADVNSEAEMLASSAVPGSWVVREDLHSTFVLLKGTPGDINNWNEYIDPDYEINLYTDPWADQEQARQDVHFEEKLEFAMEGHRFFDLVRWGEANEKLNQYLQYEGTLFTDVRGANFTDPKNDYYPIPQPQIDQSVTNGKQVLTQNAGY